MVKFFFGVIFEDMEFYVKFILIKLFIRIIIYVGINDFKLRRFYEIVDILVGVVYIIEFSLDVELVFYLK